MPRAVELSLPTLQVASTNKLHSISRHLKTSYLASGRIPKWNAKHALFISLVLKCARKARICEMPVAQGQSTLAKLTARADRVQQYSAVYTDLAAVPGDTSEAMGASSKSACTTVLNVPLDSTSPFAQRISFQNKQYCEQYCKTGRKWESSAFHLHSSIGTKHCKVKTLNTSL